VPRLPCRPLVRAQVSSISGSSSEDEDEAKPALHRSPQTIFLNAGQYHRAAHEQLLMGSVVLHDAQRHVITRCACSSDRDALVQACVS